jgi:putative ABC transport system substrate-binding protein
MNNRRKLVIALGAGALAAPFGCLAQQQGKVWRIGYLDFGSRQSVVNSGWRGALIEGLRELGYVEGKNLVLQERYAEGNSDRLNGFAAELVEQKVDLIIIYGATAARFGKRVTATIPIVITAIADPVGNGFAASLARPGGNITGMTGGAEDTNQKMVELLSVANPKLKRIAVLTNPLNDSHASLLLSVQAAARKTGKQALPKNVRTLDEIERGFATMTREHTDGVIIFVDAFLFSQRMQIAALAIKHRIPSIYGSGGYAEVGGLMSYGPDINDNFRRTAVFVDKILKGTKSGDIPFEQPTRYYFVINRKTANALGMKLTNELLVRADKVIE